MRTITNQTVFLRWCVSEETLEDQLLQIYSTREAAESELHDEEWVTAWRVWE